MNAVIAENVVNILVVEDDEIDAEVVRRAFRKHKIVSPLFHAHCGVNALEMLLGENGRKKIREPVILLVDVNMPRMNGVEFLTQLRQDPRLKATLAFMLSTSRREADIREA